MKVLIITTFIGCFGVENNRLISFKPFPKDIEKIAEKLKMSESELIAEEKELVKELEKRGFQIFFPFKKSGVESVESESESENFIKENLQNLAIKYKFVKDLSEFNQLFSKVNIELTKIKIKKSVERDRLVIHANGAIEEIEKSLNIFIERLREFYGLHFPEMNRVISDHEKFSKLVETYGSRENFEISELRPFTSKSMGMDFRKDDIEIIRAFASEINRLFKLKNELIEYLEKLMREVTPNSSSIGGAIITAKLITRAGGLEKLARMTSSTIQLLGSEKALFRSLHSNGTIPTPKYGYIAIHPLVQNAPNELKGKIARLLASKLSIAVKMDFYSKTYRGDSLKKELQARVKEILSSK